MRNWRNTTEYRKWRIAVIRRDVRCQTCSSMIKRQAHHIEQGSYNPSLRFDVSNGITLCRKCHSLLHNKVVGSFRMKCTRKHLVRFFKLAEWFTNIK